MIGKTISHYKILEKLGAGGMGVVYKAQDAKLDRFVALKFLPPHLSQDEENKKRFIHEAKAASALDHPNICTIYEIDQTEGGQMFIAMACYEGESLKEKIEHGPMAIEEAIDVATQISRGLTKAHSKNIIHRDIKPASILLTGKVAMCASPIFRLAQLGDSSSRPKRERKATPQPCNSPRKYQELRRRGGACSPRRTPQPRCFLSGRGGRSGPKNQIIAIPYCDSLLLN